MDPRSQGDSDKVDEGNYTERRARDVHEVIEQLKLGPAVLLAWSRGVIESLSLVEQFGTSGIRALVMVDGGLFRAVDAASCWRTAGRLWPNRFRGCSGGSMRKSCTNASGPPI